MNSQRLYRLILSAMLLTFIVVPAALVLVYEIRGVLYPVITGLLAAYLAYPLVRLAERVGLPRAVVVVAVVLTAVSALALTAYWLVPTARDELRVLTDPEERAQVMSRSKFVGAVGKVADQLRTYKAFRELPSDEELAQDVSEWISARTLVLAQSAGSYVSVVGQFLLIALMVFVSALMQGNQFFKTIVGMIPNSYFEPGLFILHKTTRIMGSYLRGLVIETILMAATGLVLLLAVSFFTSLPSMTAIFIALLVALSNPIRIVGPIIGLAGSALLVITNTPDLAALLAAVAAVLLVQALDGALFMPLAMQSAVQLPPAVILVGVFAGGELAGVLGMILAVPVIAGFKVVYRVAAVEMRRLGSGDRNQSAADHELLWE